MKKILVIALSLVFIAECYSQDNYFRYNGAADVSLKCSARGDNGLARALVHDVDNTLTLNYEADFSGGVLIQSDLTVWKSLKMEGNIEVNQDAAIGRKLSDRFTYGNVTLGHYSLGWVSDLKNTAYGPTLWQSGYGGIKFFTEGLPKMTVHFNGNIGIGTESPQAKLDVRGTISAEEVKVQVLNGADHVFNNDYTLKPLSEVEAFVKENKHLPEIPSEKHMQENGLNINEFQIKLLQKIEELTLYVIDLKKENLEQNKLIEGLQEQLESK